MITAVDSDVLLDVLIPGASHGARSEARLATAARDGALVISPTVAADLSAHFRREVELRAFLRDTGVKVDPFGMAALHLAGQAWRADQRKAPVASCDGCGAPLKRKHVVADYLVGAHALLQADRLLTRDGAFYRSRFAKLHLAP